MGKTSNLTSPTKDQVMTHIRFDRPVWESLKVSARQIAIEMKLSVTAADLVRKYVQEGLDRQNGKGKR